MLRIKRIATVHGAGVVPHQCITGLPGMRVHKLGLSRPLKKKRQHLFTFLRVPSDDLSRHAGAEVERLAARYWVGAGDRVVNIW